MTTESITYAQDVRPLFREYDRDSMEAWFDLWDWEDVRDHAARILERLEEGLMPCDAPWPDEQVALFRRWMEAGSPK